jgi:dienelactone hydrolase
MRRRSGSMMAMTMALAAMALASCGDDGASDVDLGGADVVADALGDLPADVPADVPADLPWDPGSPDVVPGGCGLPAYAWLPAAEVGAVVSWEEDPMWAQPKEILEDAIIGAGFGAAAPLEFGTRMYKIAYTTQDKGVPRRATALVAVPQRDDGGAATYPMVMWMHGTSGASDGCAPSLGIEGNALAALWAALGYISVAPDYLGMNAFGAPSEMKHPYLVGEPAAVAGWDAVRAAYALLSSGEITDEPARPERRVVPWGASQGGHAALYADRLARWYAPEFEVPATIALTPPANLQAQSEISIRESRLSMSNLSAFLVASARYYGHEEVLATTLTDTEPGHFRTTFPVALDTRCDFYGTLDGVTAQQEFEAPFLAGLEATGLSGMDPWGCWFQQNSLTTTSFPRGADAPVLWVMAGADELVDVGIEKGSFTTLCGQGYRMQYLECQGALHSQGSFWSMPEQKAWLKDRLAGKPLAEGTECQIVPAVQCQGTSN